MLKLVLGGLLLATVAIVATCTMATPWRRELRNKRLDEARPVDLNGYATVRLAPTFHVRGTGPTPGALVFSFEQGQHHVLGGYYANPVLLDVTLLDAPRPGDPQPNPAGTTILEFYPPVYEDKPRLAAHFAAQRWLPDVRDPSGAITRVAATNEGRGDNVSKGPPERWLAIHVDPARRVRVDLYAWRSAYTAEEASALVRQVAATVTTTPKLDERLAEIAAEERRVDERRRVAPGEAEAVLRRCGIARLVPGEATAGPTCIAHFSADRLQLYVAVLLGVVPFSASRGTPNQVPQFAVAPNAPDLGILLMWWDGAKWGVNGLQYSASGNEVRPVLDAVAARLTDRASVHVLQTYWVDFKYYPDGVDKLGPFLTEAEQHAAALIDGTLLPGLKGTTARLDR